MSTYSDRPAVRRRIVEVLGDADGLQSVQVSYARPGQATANEAIWTGPPDGTQEQVDFGSPRPGRDDHYRIDLAIAVTGFADEQTADERCQELVTATCEALFAGDRLGADWRTIALYPGDLMGPAGGRDPQGPAWSVAELAIEIHAPLRGA